MYPLFCTHHWQVLWPYTLPGGLWVPLFVIPGRRADARKKNLTAKYDNEDVQGHKDFSASDIFCCAGGHSKGTHMRCHNEYISALMELDFQKLPNSRLDPKQAHADALLMIGFNDKAKMDRGNFTGGLDHAACTDVSKRLRGMRAWNPPGATDHYHAAIMQLDISRSADIHYRNEVEQHQGSTLKHPVTNHKVSAIRAILN